MTRKLTIRVVAFAALALGLGVLASQVVAADQVASVPADMPTTEVVTSTEATGESLAVDMNSWRETGFVPGPISKRRPLRRSRK